MQCLWCDCDIHEGEEQFTEDDVGPLCDDCYDEAVADQMAVRFA